MILPRKLVLMLGLLYALGSVAGCRNSQTQKLYDEHIAQGQAYLRNADYDRALKEFNAAVSLKPESAAGYGWRGVVYAAQGNHNAALAEYQNALQRDPQGAGFWQGLGTSHLAQRNYTAAEEAYGKAMQLQPDYAEPYYGRGTLYKARGEKEKAIADFRQFLVLNKDPNWRVPAENALKELEGK